LSRGINAIVAGGQSPRRDRRHIRSGGRGARADAFRGQMDWLSVAALLAERGDQPMVLLDREGTIRLLNRAMERTLGWRQDELEGRAWAEACAPTQPASTTSSWWSQVLSGSVRRCDCEVRARNGRRILLELDVSPVGRGRDEGLLLAVRRAMPLDGDPAYIANQDLDYQITVHASEFGSLRKLVQMGRVVRIAATLARPCFELLHQRQSPCEDCPALRTVRESWPRTTIRRHTRATDGFEIVTAQPLGTTKMGLSVRFIADATLRAVHETRLVRIADEAQLSRRERVVFDYLLMGRSLDDIATILELSRHTVKFHQSNILRKLGADSRVDIIRLTGY
jgi:PAS domain S-box-containing protein